MYMTFKLMCKIIYLENHYLKKIYCHDIDKLEIMQKTKPIKYMIYVHVLILALVFYFYQSLQSVYLNQHIHI